jgi:chemosensory pili system protein ChpC
MNAPAERPDQIYAALAAVPGDTLLLPNLAVAEVLPREPLEVLHGVPNWFTGMLVWHGRRVPVISFEKLNGSRALPQPGRRTRMLIVYAIGNRIPSGMFGLMTEGYPHLVTLNRNAVRPEPLQEDDNPDLIAARARVASQSPAIPNFEYVEAEIATVLQQHAQ